MGIIPSLWRGRTLECVLLELPVRRHKRDAQVSLRKISRALAERILIYCTASRNNNARYGVACPKSPPEKLGRFSSVGQKLCVFVLSCV